MYCRFCGCELKTDSERFCHHCGKPLKDQSSNNVYVTNNENVNNVENIPAGMKKVDMADSKGIDFRRFIAPAVSVCIILIICALLYPVLYKNKLNNNDTVVNEESFEDTVDDYTTIDFYEETEENTESVTESIMEDVIRDDNNREPADTGDGYESTEIVDNDDYFDISPSELETEIEKIREQYYSPSDNDTNVIISAGVDGWDYSRQYYYHDGELYFAFIFGDRNDEHRLYFKDDHMIRYIDEDGNVFDYGNLDSYRDWEKRVLDEAY